MGRAGLSASAAVGRERENPRSERSEPAALKVQLGDVDDVEHLFYYFLEAYFPNEWSSVAIDKKAIR